MNYTGFHLLPTYAEHGGYLVQETAGENRLVAVVVKDPEASPAGRWKVRPYNAPDDTAWGRYPTLRDAAQAGYDERTV
jgi:hypothetical protein